MKKMLAAAVVSLSLAHAPSAGAQGPSAAFLAVEARHERLYWESVRNEGEIDLPFSEMAAHFSALSAEAARQTYARNWSLVQAETRRRIAALPEFDFAPYATTEPSQRLTVGLDPTLASIMSDPAMLAGARFFEPYAATQPAAMALLSEHLNSDDFARDAFARSFAPPRVYRVDFQGRPAFITTMGIWVILTPYSISNEGLIVPDMARAALYSRNFERER